MHHALELSEIVERILSYCTRESALALCRTSTWLSSCAVLEVWSTLNQRGIEGLVNIIKQPFRSRQTRADTELAQECFRRHAGYVRTLDLGHGFLPSHVLRRSLLEIISSDEFTPPMFPRLSNLTVGMPSLDHIGLVHVFLTPSLKSLHILSAIADERDRRWTTEEEASSFLIALRRNVRGLKQLMLSPLTNMSPAASFILEVQKIVIENAPFLEELEGTTLPLEGRAFRTLSQRRALRRWSPRLGDLSLMQEPRNSKEAEIDDSPIFRALTVVQLRAHLPYAVSFLNSIPARLEHLELELFTPTAHSPGDLHGLLGAIGRSHITLRSLKVVISERTALNALRLPSASPFVDLRACSALTKFIFGYSTRRQCIMDSSALHVALGAWMHLTHFEMIDERMDLEDMPVLARNCPDLIYVHILGISVPYDCPLPLQFPYPRRQNVVLSLFDVNTPFPHAVALYLHQLWPCLQIVSR